MAVAELKRVARGPWVEWAGRLGLLAKGVLYGIVACLALAIPLGLGGKATDREGALQTVAAQPFGKAMLVALAIGFAGYALWRFVQAFLGADEDSKVKELGTRAGYVGRGLVYAGTCVVAIALVVGAGSGGSSEREEAAKVLDLPLGRWIVGAVGLGFLAAGLFNLYRSLTEKFRKDLREHQMHREVRSWAIAVGVFGHAARGVVFGLIGAFLVKAAVQYDAKEAIGLDGALRKVVQADYGTYLLGLVAAGLAAYALFSLIQARYREV